MKKRKLDFAETKRVGDFGASGNFSNLRDCCPWTEKKNDKIATKTKRRSGRQ